MIDRRHFTRLATLTAAAAAVTSAPAARAVTRRAIVRPKKLAEGDTVGLVSPASAAFEDDSVNLAKEQLEALGFKVRIGQHAYDRHGYFAGPDRERAADINRFFADKSIAGIVCYTGGWGSPRVLPHLDWNVIRDNPKVFLGYSDVTALLNAIHQRTGLVTFHGPVGASGFDPYTLDNFRRVVMSSEPAGLLPQPPKPKDDLIDRRNRILKLAPGKATGRLAGGNLTMIASAMGTPYQLDTEGAIVFLEDVREELYRVDRMLTQLAHGGLFANAKGVVFGRCTNCDSQGPGFSLEEILRDRFGSLGIPAISGLSFGHIDQKLTIPVGVTATLDADAGTLTLDEAAVA